MKTKVATELILKALRKKQKESKNYSLRKLSEKLKVSNSFLSKVLRGQKTLNLTLAKKFCDEIGMDSLQRKLIIESVESDPDERQPVEVDGQYLSEFELAPQDAEWVLSRWYYVAVLDLMNLAIFQESPAWVAAKLGITIDQALEAFRRLESIGLAERDKNGKLRKKHDKLRFPTKFSKSIVREFHKAQIKRAVMALDSSQSRADFERRLITGITVAANSKHYKRAEAILHKAIYKAMQALSEGECDELYQINLQMFPQTKNNP